MRSSARDVATRLGRTLGVLALLGGLTCGASPLFAFQGTLAPPSAAPEGAWDRFPKVDAAQPFLDYAKAWPARVGDAGARGICIDIPGPTFRPRAITIFFDPEAVPAADNPDAKALFTRFGLPLDSKIVLEGARAFVESAAPVPDGPRPPRRLVNPAAATFKFVSAREIKRDDHTVYAIDHTLFTYFEPAGEAAQHPKGLVLLLPGLLATPEGTLWGLTRTLQSRGYGVLRMVAQPARFLEHTSVTVDPASPERAEREINELFTQRLAECAYASKGALDHLIELHPELKALPLAAIGFSGGAITLPTIVALEPERYRAAVMVGGGAHFWQMQEFSNYSSMIDALEVNWTIPPTEESKQAIRDAYAKGVPLDALHTSKALHGKPMLVIQGDADQAVPSPLGDVLWERLGKPERWLEHCGHEDLFISLPLKFEAIAQWLDKALGADAASAPSPSPSGSNETP
ncbi:MAG: hypothetical protein GC200_06590 [Tepidisphaera sp.]|nr:hypothetical protein [Tepidisphaera sp.]